MDWHLCLRVVGTMALVPMCWVGVYMTVRSLVNVFAERRDPEWSSRSRIAEFLESIVFAWGTMFFLAVLAGVVQ